MRALKGFNNRLVYSFIGGVLCLGTFKMYVYITDKEQAKDSNLLVAVGFTLIATAGIYLLLRLISIFTSSKNRL